MQKLVKIQSSENS